MELRTIIVLLGIALVCSVVVFAIVIPKRLATKKELLRTRNELLHLYEAFARLQQYGDKTGNCVVDSRYSLERIQKRIKDLEKQL